MSLLATTILTSARETLESYLSHLDARCVSANVEGVSGVERTAVVTLENGLRVGITGVTTHFVNLWEKQENLVGIKVHEAFPAAAAALEELKQAGVDVTVCIYHGGFENDLTTGELLSDTGENQAYRICRELDFDILLTGHQHQAKAGLQLFGTYACQSRIGAGSTSGWMRKCRRMGKCSRPFPAG